MIDEGSTPVWGAFLFLYRYYIRVYWYNLDN